MNSLINKWDNKLNKTTILSRLILLTIIIVTMILIYPMVHADWVITTQGEPGILILDENGYSHWTQSIVLEKKTTTLTFEDNVNIKFLSFAFIVIGLWLITIVGFNYRDFLMNRK